MVIAPKILTVEIEKELIAYFETGISDYSKLLEGLEKGDYIMESIPEKCGGGKGKGRGKGKGK